ncbi:MAG: MBL fold metallo-hydrolase [Kiritimatiellae bacterium]|nr:MBL fold metallo-hydrolase [Kiritimatiellia bacterium]
MRDIVDVWQAETSKVDAATFNLYLRDGDTRGLKSLERLEKAFDKVLRGARRTKVGDVPAVWSVYNMGFVVKTRESLFSIDLVHRRAQELAPLLDFALITHNHDDHWREDFFNAMDGAGKTVISNFLANYGAADWRKGGPCWYAAGGYTRAKKVFKIRDVEIRTSLIDHNNYLVDFTTAFEIRVGDWTLYHTGDGGSGTEGKLETVWGRPDLWLFFPGCGINVAEVVRRIRPKRLVFGHLWELAHDTGRCEAQHIRGATEAARSEGVEPALALWGSRVEG